jgi:SAM-dependent methyltransferase
MSDLYKHPEQYEREHFGEDEDIGFYRSLCRRLAPQKVLELGCGTGRITVPLAELGFEVVGLDSQPEMLRKAEERRLQSRPEIRERLEFIEGDMRTWSGRSDFDLILIPCSSISHLLALRISSRCGKPAIRISELEGDSWWKLLCRTWPRLPIPSACRHVH